MGLEPAVDGQGGFVPPRPPAQGCFEEGLGDSRKEEQFYQGAKTQQRTHGITLNHQDGRTGSSPG